ncbi:MAG: HEAT repeat domain-containing protein [Myxococcales bacterium]|nr:HEAT repeat domain-containing protein [Myxococcales bacterium]
MTDSTGPRTREALADIAAVLRHGDEQARLEAVRRLPDAGDPGSSDVLALLEEALGDDSFRVRKEAVRVALAWRDQARLAERMVEVLAEPDNVGRRNAALEIVTGLGLLALEPLLRALQGLPKHRKLLVEALGSLSGAPVSRVAPALCAALRDEDPNVRAAAAEALGALVELSPEVQGALRRVLVEDTDLVVRLGALEALNRHQIALPVAMLQPLLGELVLRPAVLLALGRSGDPNALPFLLEGLLDRARGTREASMRGLCDLHARVPEARMDIEAHLRGLSELALRSTIRALLEASPDARAAAATLLRFSGHPGVVRPLVLALLDQHQAVATAAEETLATLGDAAVEVLCDLLPDLDAAGRAVLLSFFARAGAALKGQLKEATQQRVLVLLCRALSEPNPQAATAAARALGVLGGPAAVDSLRQAAAAGGPAAAEALVALEQLQRRLCHEAREP